MQNSMNHISIFFFFFLFKIIHTFPPSKNPKPQQNCIRKPKKSPKYINNILPLNVIPQKCLIIL